MGLLDLEKHFGFYGAYHSNPINVAIHIIFVWPILFTALILLYFTPPLFSPTQLGFIIHPVLVFNLGFFFTVFYALFYAALDTKAGSLAALLTFLCWVGASFVANNLGFALAWKVVLAAQLICWTGQFIGHGVFEKRAPALLDNLVQAFLMAPFFVLLEVLQSSVGYEPYPGFQTRVKARIEADIKQWQDKKQKKLS
ncbi:2-hydroxy-palmitic acid dioxygenase MPO1 isoform X1 [Gastrolobium bilobum]|uniref:2-hydroxy-palmitic acid dioxygenase MPO1 isoform X1 n=1 Tax=Gastrolobium bilobum TaxID=150636 RepID=UPI002AB2FEB3|nr:2-hydroxy-palmitic acid dioxygenase MPO1 isoform X1 [Gastrolobium bilobum]